MKKKLTLILFCLMLQVTVAQNSNWLANDPIWQVNSSCAVGYPCIRQETLNYYFIGDTLLNGMLYKQVFKKGQGQFNWMAAPPAACSGTFSYIDTVPCYFLREAGMKIFLRQPLDTAEYLLYDFDLAIGDTLPVTFNNFQADVYVTAIDSFFTPYGYRKRFALAGNNSATHLIEGVGSSNGLFEPIPLMLECGYMLNCFSLHDTAYYPTLGPSCNLAVALPTVSMLDILTVAPNPFSSYTIINSNRMLHKATLTINNSIGQTVKVRSQITGHSITLLREELSQGLYFIRLTEGSQLIASQKLMVTD
ncbi:MAG: T9SS type A sorting domain-containing protein [Bacteroidota bacterium]